MTTVIKCISTKGLNQVICGNPARALRARRKKKGLMQQVRNLTCMAYVITRAYYCAYVISHIPGHFSFETGKGFGTSNSKFFVQTSAQSMVNSDWYS